jgi:hypothetical protein
MSPDRAPERSPLIEITRTDALLWLNDRVGAIVSIGVEVGGGGPGSAALSIGDAKLRHWSNRETHDYVAAQKVDEGAGRYYLGERTVLDLACFAAGSHLYRANGLHLVIDVAAGVTLRITGHKPDTAQRT